MGLLRKTSIPALLVLCQIVCTETAQQCREEYSIYVMKLNRHIFKKTKASNWSVSLILQCAFCQLVKGLFRLNVVESNYYFSPGFIPFFPQCFVA